MMSTDLVI